MSRKTHIISMYNMHSSGSWVILNTILKLLPEYFPDALFILPSNCSRTAFEELNIKPIYLSIPKSKACRILHSFLIDQFLVPLLALSFRANQVIHFGNVASYISPCSQRVFFHNALFLPSYPLSSLPGIYLLLQRHYVLFSLLFSKATLFVQNEYMKSQFSLNNNFKDFKIYIIGNPFDNNTYTKKYLAIDHCLEALPKYESIKTKFKYLALYPSFPHSYKDHHFLLKQVNFFNSKSIHVILTCTDKSLGLSTEFAGYQLHEAFSFLGSQKYNKLQWLYQICDLILFPSRLESLGLPIIEAANYKKPLIVPALPYATSSVRDAYFYDPESSNLSSEFAKICSKLLRDIENKEALVPVPIINTSANNFLKWLRDLK